MILPYTVREDGYHCAVVQGVLVEAKTLAGLRMLLADRNLTRVELAEHKIPKEDA